MGQENDSLAINDLYWKMEGSLLKISTMWLLDSEVVW